jgi:hypothetical protein
VGRGGPHCGQEWVTREGVRPPAVMDGGGVKSSVGWDLEARMRDEDNRNGL